MNKDTLQIQYEIHKQFPDNYDAQIVIEIPEKMTFDTMDFDIGRQMQILHRAV